MCYSGRLIYKSLFLYQGYTKGIQKIGNSAQSSALKNFFQKKYTIAEVIIIQQLLYAIYAFLPQKSPISSPKTLKRRRFSTPIIYKGTNIWSTPATDKTQLAHRYAFFVLCSCLFLRAGTLRTHRSECVPSHSFRSRSLQSIWEQPKSHRKQKNKM